MVVSQRRSAFAEVESIVGTMAGKEYERYCGILNELAEINRKLKR